MTDNTNHPYEQPLESWKEIAAYLKRDVRTVIRWEKSEGLPVHRQMHQARGSVFAYPSELEAWKGSRERRLDTAPLMTPWRRVTAAVGFALAMLLALVTMASGPIPTPTRAAAAEEGSGIRFWQVKFDGLEATPFAQLSPDGKEMLYVDMKNWKENQFSLRIMDLSSGQHQPVVEDFGDKQPWNSFKWSPDGSKVVYTDKQRRQLRVISSKGGESQLLWSSPDPETWVKPMDWSRDGNRILAAVVNDTEWTIRYAVLSAAGGEPRFVVSGKNFELDEDSGHFSPDGRFIVGQRWEGGKNSHIWVWAADSGQEICQVEETGSYSIPFWSPDGKYLVFISERLKTLDLWAVPMSDGRPAGVPFRVKQGLGKNTSLTGFTPAGQLTMLITGEGTPSDLFVLPVDRSTGEARGGFAPLAKYPTDHFNPRWSPDGKRVAYVSRKGQQRWPSIYIDSLGGKEEQEIPVESYYVENVEWSPDAAHLLIAGFLPNGNVGIYRISLEDHKITPLHLGGRLGPGFKGAFANLQWLPRANKFIFSKVADADHIDIYTMDGDGKQVQLIAEKVPTSAWAWPSPDAKQIAFREGQNLRLLTLADKTSITIAKVPPGAFATGPAWSPDARNIAFTDTRHLKVLSAGGSTPRVLVEAPEDSQISGMYWWSGLAWSPDGSSIAYLLQKGSKTAGASSELWAVPAAGGAPRRIAAPPASHPLLSDVIWHPSGDMIVATGEAGKQQKRENEHWVMENFLPGLKAAR